MVRLMRAAAGVSVKMNRVETVWALLLLVCFLAAVWMRRDETARAAQQRDDLRKWSIAEFRGRSHMLLLSLAQEPGATTELALASRLDWSVEHVRAVRQALVYEGLVTEQPGVGPLSSPGLALSADGQALADLLIEPQITLASMASLGEVTQAVLAVNMALRVAFSTLVGAPNAHVIGQDQTVRWLCEQNVLLVRVQRLRGSIDETGAVALEDALRRAALQDLDIAGLTTWMTSGTTTAMQPHALFRPPQDRDLGALAGDLRAIEVDIYTALNEVFSSEAGAAFWHARFAEEVARIVRAEQSSEPQT